MTFFLVASGASLTIGIGLGCLIVTLRDLFNATNSRSPFFLPSCAPVAVRPPPRSSHP